jgi:hypothetical protein
MTEVVMVVVAIVVTFGEATIAVAVVMTAVAIKGLGGSATVVTLRSSAIEIAAGIRSVHRAVVGESARAARAGANVRTIAAAAHEITAAAARAAA